MERIFTQSSFQIALDVLAKVYVFNIALEEEEKESNTFKTTKGK